MPQPGLQLVGVSFRTAPVVVREQLSFAASEAIELLRTAGACMPSLEAVVLSTCNRTEFYLGPATDPELVQSFLMLVRRMRPRAPILHDACFRYQLGGADALRHLLRVACGLDSAVLGDLQIVSQVKQAVGLASVSGTLGRTLSQAFTHAVRAARRARSETAISRGASSLGSALAELVAGYLHQTSLSGPARILILGAGQIARDIGTHLAKRHCGELRFLNRTFAGAESLACYCGGRALPLERLESELDKADVVIAATAAPEPLLPRPVLDRIASQGRSPLVVDAGVPRNVEPGSSLQVWDIDDIRERRESVLAERQAAVPAVEQIIEEQMAAWERWQAAQELEADIALLYECAARRGREAASELFASGAVSSPQQAERIVSRAIRRVLHQHTRKLRNNAYRPSLSQGSSNLRTRPIQRVRQRTQ